jgi:hypothetical protein
MLRDIRTCNPAIKTSCAIEDLWSRIQGGCDYLQINLITGKSRVVAIPTPIIKLIMGEG